MALRVALAVTFIWFGGLKVAFASPVADLVARAMPIGPARLVVPALGAFEVVVGFGLLHRRTLKVALCAFFFHMLGTLSVLVRLPTVAFRDNNPLLLTTLGEFVLKNVVLLAAGIAVMGTMQRRGASGSTASRSAHAAAARQVDEILARA